eukprot:TRINITY_DN13114_c0_g1_i1.p1 TRINITY_DN13114_c0_g1~~TRINITY_DN13114_c0_g1_i1.p1  ORF type:complete len:427 (+),score=20.73 TRINITY_DN13114_c0_g1_i1:65-1282(+)
MSSVESPETGMFTAATTDLRAFARGAPGERSGSPSDDGGLWGSKRTDARGSAAADAAALCRRVLDLERELRDAKKALASSSERSPSGDALPPEVLPPEIFSVRFLPGCPLRGWGDFLSKPGWKAFTIGPPRPHEATREWGAAWGRPSQRQATEEALEVCLCSAPRAALIYPSVDPQAQSWRSEQLMYTANGVGAEGAGVRALHQVAQQQAPPPRSVRRRRSASVSLARVSVRPGERAATTSPAADVGSSKRRSATPPLHLSRRNSGRPPWLPPSPTRGSDHVSTWDSPVRAREPPRRPVPVIAAPLTRNRGRRRRSPAGRVPVRTRSVPKSRAAPRSFAEYTVHEVRNPSPQRTVVSPAARRRSAAGRRSRSYSHPIPVQRRRAPYAGDPYPAGTTPFYSTGISL